MYDVCVIGGGPAGLTAALYLARYHLTVSLVDAGQSRAALIPRTHNQLLWADGIGGAELLDRMRNHVAKYPVAINHDTVEEVTRIASGFQVRTLAGTIRARAVLVATGVENHRPSMNREDHALALHRGLLRYCPICDGYEVTDKTVAVVGCGDRLFGEAKFLRSYTSSVTALAEETSIGLSNDQREELLSMDVNIIDTPASEYRISDAAIDVLLGSTWEGFDTVYAALGSTIRTEFVSGLGVETTAEGCLTVDEHQRTSVRGLYAAGDIVAGVDQIAHAMGQATVAATAVRNDLAGQKPLMRRGPARTLSDLEDFRCGRL